MSNVVTPIQVPLINGVAYSFGHVALRVAGIDYTGGFAEINYSRKRDREDVRSNHPDPVAVTLGENAYTCTAVVYLAWWLATIRTIRNRLGHGYGDKSFPVYVSYSATGFDPFQDVILGCHFDSTEAGNAKGIAALTRTVDFHPVKILFDGDDDLEVPLVGTSF